MTSRSAPSTAEPRGAAAAARAYAGVALMVAGSTLAGLTVAPRWGTAPVDLLYLPAVLAAASLFGLRPALLAAAASALAYNFYFTAPLHTLRIDRPADLVTVLVLFAVALVTSQLAARMREQARLARANAERNATIAGLARRLLSASGTAEIGFVACSEIAGLFGCNAVLALPGDEAPQIMAQSPGAGRLNPSDLAAATLAIATGEPAGRGSPRLDPAEWLFRPIRGETRVIGALGLARDDGREALAEAQSALLSNLIDQLALALERAALEAEARDAAMLRERDRLSRALVSSVGHDLRTPLTTIIAAAAELRSAPGRSDLAVTVAEEATRLERYVSNLLDMARIEAGSLRLREEPIDLVDTVAAAVEDLGSRLDGEVIVELPPDLPLVRADAKLLHHMLINLIDNAARHGGEGGETRIRGSVENGGVRLSVADRGPGLAGAGKAVFDRFASGAGSDRKGGAGLGLAIVRAFAQAMGMEVEAGDRSGGGAEFTLVFPAPLIVEEAGLAEAAAHPGR